MRFREVAILLRIVSAVWGNSGKLTTSWTLEPGFRSVCDNQKGERCGGRYQSYEPHAMQQNGPPGGLRRGFEKELDTKL